MITRSRAVVAMLALAVVLPACSSGMISEPPSTPEPTSLPEPAPMPTSTSPPSRVKAGFTPNQDNPVFIQGAPEAWDSETVFNARIVFEAGQYHLFYSGSSSLELTSMAIGYATSTDGVSFARSTALPLLEADGTGFDARKVSTGVPLTKDGKWVLYYSAGGGQAGPGNAIGRATAPAPAGPWTRESHPVLTVGERGEWDSGFVIPESVIDSDGEYVMYYSGGAGWPEGTSGIGRATSPDGITWTKHDDPGTTDPPFAQSDPVLQPGFSGSWDSASVWGCTVLKSDSGWEMFYTGGDARSVQIGYATSTDGIGWTKHPENPIFSPTNEPMIAEGALPILQSPSVIKRGATYILYYDYGISKGAIGMATGTIPTNP